jgi:hypothetical protein
MSLPSAVDNLFSGKGKENCVTEKKKKSLGGNLYPLESHGDNDLLASTWYSKK